MPIHGSNTIATNHHQISISWSPVPLVNSPIHNLTGAEKINF